MSERAIIADAQKVRSLRRSLGLSQSKLAGLADLSNKSVWKAENGVGILPETLRRIAEKLGVTPAELQLTGAAIQGTVKSVRQFDEDELERDHVFDDDVTRYVCDLLAALPEQRIGVRTEIVDLNEYLTWTTNLIGMLQDLYSARQPDAYAAWLRPSIQHPRKLKVFQQHNMPEDYRPYEFQLDEGLAGKVWSTGKCAATSEIRRHPWWEYRTSCLSACYICVPVGQPKSIGGVLAVGSFSGFAVSDLDLNVVRMFASLLGIVEIPCLNEQSNKVAPWTTTTR